jgi:hypothetical protein
MRKCPLLPNLESVFVVENVESTRGERYSLIQYGAGY